MCVSVVPAARISASRDEGRQGSPITSYSLERATSFNLHRVDRPSGGTLNTYSSFVWDISTTVSSTSTGTSSPLWLSKSVSSSRFSSGCLFSFCCNLQHDIHYMNNTFHPSAPLPNPLCVSFAITKGVRRSDRSPSICSFSISSRASRSASGCRSIVLSFQIRVWAQQFDRV